MNPCKTLSWGLTPSMLPAPGFLVKRTLCPSRDGPMIQSDLIIKSFLCHSDQSKGRAGDSNLDSQVLYQD